jgi:FMN phosphatase YigB (HAD superfamily)
METRLEAPPPAADTRLAPAFEAVASRGAKALSVDVFDTLLFRRVAKPVDAFEVVADRLREGGLLASETTPEVFAQVREATERRLRERRLDAGQGLEVSLADIYAELPRSLLARPVPVAELEQVECAVESELLVADLDVLALVREAQQRGLALAAISDTYFSARQLRLFIARGPLASVRFDHVVASSQHGAGKATGLFSVLLEQLGCAPEELVHVGDNQQSDVAVPRRLGIQAVYFERVPDRLERVLERERVQASGSRLEVRDEALTALRGKVLHRAEAARQPAGLRPLWEFGAASLGPAFAGFAEWVQEQAAEAEVSKVLCLMREGELIARLVEAARPDDGGPAAEPLWLSRQVCARASIREGTPDELCALFDRREMPTVRELCGSLGLSVDDLPAFAGRADHRIDDRALGDEVVDAIVFDPDLRAKVVAHSHALRRRLLRYVEERRPPGESKLVLVDLGWGGTIQATVDQLLREAGVDCHVVGLYLITHHVALSRALEGLDIRSYLGRFGIPSQAVQAIARSPEVLEQVCMPDVGSQIDLTEEGRPVLAELGEPSLQAVERAAVQQGILAFQREWRRYRGSLSSSGARERLLAMVTRAVAAPTPDEAALFSGWLHDENFGSQRVESVTAGPTVGALGHLDPKALVQTPMTELYWPFGLASLHDEQLAQAVAAASAGLLPWEAFSSELESGPFGIEPDLGWGFEEHLRSQARPRRNRRGLSYVRATLRGEYLQRVRLQPATRACLVRLDWIRLRCRVREGTEAVAVELRDPAELRRLRLQQAHWIGPQLLLVTGEAPGLILDLRRLVDRPVYEAVVEVGFAALPLVRSQARERWARAKGALRRVAKETPVGAPLRAARRILRRRRG